MLAKQTKARKKICLPNTRKKIHRNFNFGEFYNNTRTSSWLPSNEHRMSMHCNMLGIAIDRSILDPAFVECLLRDRGKCMTAADPSPPLSF